MRDGSCNQQRDLAPLLSFARSNLRYPRWSSPKRTRAPSGSNAGAIAWTREPLTSRVVPRGRRRFLLIDATVAFQRSPVQNPLDDTRKKSGPVTVRFLWARASAVKRGKEGCDA